jgi:hypothetical protein
MAKNITIAKLNTLITANSVQFKNELSKASGIAVAFGDKMDGIAKKVVKFGAGVALAAAAGVGMLGKSVVDLGSRIVDLSSVAGMSTDTFQKISATAMDSGVSMEEVAKASENLRSGLQDASEKGSDPLNESLAKLNLTAEGLKSLAPEDQWAVIAERVANAADKQEALNVVSDLFGSKLGPKLRQTLDAIAQGYDQIDQPMIDKKSLAIIDEAGDKWDKMWLKVQVGAAKAFSATYNVAKRLRDDLKAEGFWMSPDAPATPQVGPRTTTAFPEVDELHKQEAAAKLEARMKKADEDARLKNPMKSIEEENELKKNVDSALNAFFDPLDEKSKMSPGGSRDLGINMAPTDTLSRIGLQTGAVPPEQKKQTDLLSQISKLLSSIDRGVRSPAGATFSN